MSAKYDADENDEATHERPPKQYQFTKGRSGCPTGGHRQRRAKQEAKTRKAQNQDQQLSERLAASARRMRTIRTKEGDLEISAAAATFLQTQQDALQMKVKACEEYFRILRECGGLRRPSQSRGGGVITIYPVSADSTREAAEPKRNTTAKALNSSDEEPAEAPSETRQAHEAREANASD